MKHFPEFFSNNQPDALIIPNLLL